MSRLTQGSSNTLRIRGYHPLWPDFPDRSAYLPKTTGLFRVRSPLLAESLLMSFPPGTEMFQFPGFASYTYVFSVRYPCGWVAPFGYPRINACSRLPVAFRSVPRPSSPPGAKASTECPSYTRYPGHRSEGPTPHHAQKPSSDLAQGLIQVEARTRIILQCSSTPHTTGSCQTHRHRQLACADRHRIHPTRSFTTPLNPRRPTVGALFLRTTFPVRQVGRTTGPATHPKTDA